MILHAGLMALRFGGRWRGVLIEGASGSGKSDLALRLMDAGLRLVADDRVLIWSCQGRVYGRAPAPLARLMEVRGHDVLSFDALRFCAIDLIVRPGVSERMPQQAFARLLDCDVAMCEAAYLESSAPAKIRLRLQHLGHGAEGAYLVTPLGELGAPSVGFSR